MAHRKDRKEELRRERERREAEARAAAQRKRLVGIGAAAAIVIVAVVVVVALAAGGGGGSDAKGSGDVFPEGGSVPKPRILDVTKAAAAAGCKLTSNRATSREHTTNLNQKVTYKQNPPNSGKHYQIPAEDGLYQQAPPDVTLVHAQEHGRIVVWVKPSLPVDARKQVRALFDEDKYQMLVVPRANMPYAIAATAWGHDPTPNGTGFTLGCPRWDENVIDAIRTFRDEHRSNGPEAVP
jgi:Protein of unknown function (DUF3105)